MGILGTASPFPPPLRGRVREGGSRIGTARVDPLPQPFPARGKGAYPLVPASLVARHP
ncbi:hypothetical protein V1277_002228 [Bradyrhizobium sp. AZCC 1588]